MTGAAGLQKIAGGTLARGVDIQKSSSVVLERPPKFVIENVSNVQVPKKEIFAQMEKW